MPWIIS